jgi:hypothetical protein
MKKYVLTALALLAVVGIALAQRQGPQPGQQPGQPQQVQPLPQLPPGTASLSGTVTSLSSSQPIPNANVELRRIDCNNFSNPPEVLTAKTDANGKYAFSNLRPGGWCIVATVAGGQYTPAEYMQRGTLGRGATIPVSDGQKVTNINLVMAPTGGISGRVRDADGEYMGHARVQVMEPFYEGGQRRLYILQVAQTDDRGEYRFFWLPPGPYYVAVVPENTRARNVVSVQPPPGTGGHREDVIAPVIFPRIAPNGEKTEEVYVTIYYPSERDPQRALPVEVQPGNTTNGIDIVLASARARSFHVRGVAKNSVTGEPAAGAQLRLAPKEWTATVVLPTATVDPKGNFDIAGVVPGSYVLVGNQSIPNPAAPAQAPAAPGAGRQQQPQPAPAAGAAPQPPAQITITTHQPIDVNNTSVDGIQINLVQGVGVAGRIAFEGTPPQNGARGLNMSLVREPDVVGLPASQLRGMVQQDGTFSIANVGPGEYRVYVNPLLAPFQWGVPNVPQGLQNLYVKSVRLGSLNLLTDRVRVSQGASPGDIEVVIGNGGRVEGTVGNDRRDAASNVMVALIPEGALRQRTDLYRTATSDVNGKFRMQGVPGGLYKAYAFEEAPLDIWQSADFMRPLETRGVAVEVRENGQANVDIVVIPKARRP